MTRLLFVLPGLVPPGENATRDKLFYLSEIAEGEALLPVWWDTAQKAPPFLQRTFPEYRIERFRYHMFLAFKYPKLLRKPFTFFYYIRQGLRLHREKPIDVIFAYGTNSPGMAALMLKWLTGAKLVVEIPGAPENAYRYDHPNQSGLVNPIKRFWARKFLIFVGSCSDCIKLLYPWQLTTFPSLRHKRVSVFHDFVPVHTISKEEPKELFVLSVGYPWYTKGMDVLIRAFKLIAAKFPGYKLKLMGFFPDREYLEKLADGHPQIEFLAARPNDLALRVIGACTVYVLASRTEGLPRVLLEAMAASKPIVAAAVGGVPSCVRDGDNGLLFEPENISELSDKIAQLLGNGELRTRMSDRGYARVMNEFDEGAYVRSFQAMLKSLQDGAESKSEGKRDTRNEVTGSGVLPS